MAGATFSSRTLRGPQALVKEMRVPVLGLRRVHWGLSRAPGMKSRVPVLGLSRIRRGPPNWWIDSVRSMSAKCSRRRELGERLEDTELLLVTPWI